MARFLQRLRRTDGQAMIEYSILIGLITVAIIASVTSVGTWVGTQWTGLTSALGL